MPTWETSQLLLFLAFSIPGFVSIKIWELLVPSRRRDIAANIAEAIGFSALNFVVLIPVIVPVLATDGYFVDLWLKVIVLYVVFLVAPALWPFVLARALNSRWAERNLINPVRRPWDKLFGLRETRWIIIHLTDGRRIGGFFGRHSVASVYPEEEQIYVESLWKLGEKNEFLEKIPSSRGVLVSAKDIRAIEFFE